MCMDRILVRREMYQDEATKLNLFR